MADVDRCVMCNDAIPEGGQVCLACKEKVLNEKGEKTMKTN